MSLNKGLAGFVLVTICFLSDCTGTKKTDNDCGDRAVLTNVTTTELLLQNIEANYNLEFNKLGYVEFPNSLKEDKNFARIINKICAHKNNLITIITYKNYSNLSKNISIYALQRLCINDYVEVIKAVYDSKLNITDKDWIYNKLIIQELSTEILKNYSNPSLVAILKNVRSTTKSSSLEGVVDDIISGERPNEVTDFYKRNSNGSLWSCQN